MPDVRRTLLAGVPAGAVIAVAWLRLEHPLGASAWWRAVVLVALALVAAALPGWRLRAAGSIVAAVLAVGVAFGVWLPLHPVAGLGHARTDFDNGVLDFYATRLPFDPRAHVAMAQTVLAAVFCLTLAAALLAAARKPMAAALALLAGAVWPATLLGPSHGVAIGAALLAAELALLASLTPRRVSALALPVAAAVVLAAVAVGSATAARNAALGWQSWNPARSSAPASVSFVWNAQYRGLHWPRRTTVVLDVRSKRRPGYLRAAVLDDFSGGRWIEGPPRAADALEPAAALRPSQQTKEAVTVEGLSGDRLAGGSVPVRFSASAPLVEPQRGFARVPAGLARGFQYTVWSYSPTPSPAALSRAPARYPKALVEGGMLDVGDGIRLPPFGVRHRAANVIVALGQTNDLYRYVPLVRLAERITRGARSPYAAVIDLDRWFLVGGGFRYSDHPRVTGPPLVGFTTRTRAGYCQFFAGAMALMLRYLGIPARVAVGFAGPTYDAAGRSWTFTDHNAHAWVEVWFKGYGWLLFDPTPPAPGSTRSPLFGAAGRGSGETFKDAGVHEGLGRLPVTQGKGLSRAHLGHAAGGGGLVRRASGGISGGLLFLLVLAAAVCGIVATKEGRRLVRLLDRDPRRVAASCREELAGFLLDQGIDSPPSATVRDLGALAARKFGADAERFVVAATAARYGRIETAAVSARAARRELRVLRRSCRRYLTGRQRLLGLLSLRSLMRVRAVDASGSLGSSGS